MNPPPWPGQQPPGQPGFPPPATPAVPPAGPPLPGGPGFPPPRRSGGGGALVWLLIVGAVLVLAVVGTGAVLVLGGDDDDSDRTSTLPSTSVPTYQSTTEPSPTSSGGAVDPSGVLGRTIRTAKGNTFTQAGTRTESCITRANSVLLPALRTHPCVGSMYSAVYASPSRQIITSVSILKFATSTDASIVKGYTNQEGWPKLLTPSDASGLPQPRADPAYWTRTWTQGANVIYAQSYWSSGGPTGGRDGSIFATAGELGVEVTNTLLWSN
ncbi:hypothetical protein [Spirillospora sp. CA-128828]|uniref:hypothetical protein n=1 Tax=Spirillospora sp. CA-128828 TaxID=3240033 RepID=UPI003D934A25